MLESFSGRFFEVMMMMIMMMEEDNDNDDNDDEDYDKNGKINMIFIK